MSKKEVDKAVHIATQIAEEHQHQNYGAAHLMKAMLNRDFSLLRYLHNLGLDVYYMEEWAEVRLEEYPKRSVRHHEVVADDTIQAVFEEAEDVQKTLKKEELDLLCLFIAAITPGVAFSFDQLKTVPVNHAQLKGSTAAKENTGDASIPTELGALGTIPASTGALTKYTVDLLGQAKKGVYRSIVDANRELKKIAEILSRKSKPNVIVIGESGVGKTTLIQNLAREIQQEKIVETLRHVQLLEINTAALLSGASYKGEVEDRLQSIFDEAKGFQNR